MPKRPIPSAPKKDKRSKPSITAPRKAERELPQPDPIVTPPTSRVMGLLSPGKKRKIPEPEPFSVESFQEESPQDINTMLQKPSLRERETAKPRKAGGLEAFPTPPRSRSLPPKPPGLESPTSKGPPLFIKLEKYQDVINTLHKMKSFSLSLRDALDALADVEKEFQHGISLAHRALDRFNTNIAELDTKISRLPPKESFLPDERAELGEMDDFVRNLHEQVENMRKNLKSASV